MRNETARPNAHFAVTVHGAARLANAVTLTTDSQTLLASMSAALARGATDEARACGRDAQQTVRHAAAPAAFAGDVARAEARAAMMEGDTDAALDALAAALAIAQATLDNSAMAQALNNTAIVHFQCGRLDEAEQMYEAAREVAHRAGERHVVGQVTLNLGIVANVRGDLRKALSCYRRALIDLRALGAEQYVLGTLNNLGMVYADLGQWHEAETAYAEALDVCAAVGDFSVLARLHANLAEVWVGVGDLARARASCTDAERACDRIEHGGPRGEVHKMCGVVARESGALDDADVHFSAAEDIARARQDLLLLAEVGREQGDLYRRQGRNRDTLVVLNRSHQLFRQLRAQRDLADIDRRVGRLEGEFLEVARRWGESIEAKDCYTQGHCQRVADLACLIAEHAGPAHGFDVQTMFWYRIGALLHDVGKLDVPADVLNKPGKLTDDEWAMMRGHAEAGVTLLGDLEFPWDVRPVVLSHHERWDGRGYPHGLAGDAIPLSARVLAVADVYDALTSVRSYKRAMAHDDAMRILRQDAGTAFDPQVIGWFDAVAPSWLALLTSTAASVDAGTAFGTDARVTSAMRDERRAAGLDEVTGLPGRQAFFEECARVLAARADDGRPTTLVLFSVGPGAGASAVGEGALIAAAEAMCVNTRGGDFVGRYAEREFVVLLPDTNADEGAVTAARLSDAIATALRRVPFELAAATVEAAVSVAPEHGTTAAALLAAADANARRARGSRSSTAVHGLQPAT